MTVDPRMFAPADLGSIYANAQQFRAQQEDRQLRLGELQQRTQTQQQEAARERAQVLGRLARGVRQAPLADRPALIQRLTPQLRAMGVTEEEIAGFDPSDANLDALAMMSGERDQQPTSLQRDYEFMESIEPGLGRRMVDNRAAGAPVLFDVTGDGVPDLVPREYFNSPQQPAPQQARPSPAPAQGGARPDAAALRQQAEDAIRRGADPAQVNARLRQMLGEGGPSQGGSGNFP